MALAICFGGQDGRSEALEKRCAVAVTALLEEGLAEKLNEDKFGGGEASSRGSLRWTQMWTAVTKGARKRRSTATSRSFARMSEDALMTKQNLEFGDKYYEEVLNDTIVEQNGLEDGKRQGTSSVSHSHLFLDVCGRV
mmetsp:Transcript_99013/g.319181  ORF Transcript_99013/g.319181 Transcript_99013/m.319181 type:complete len:138 (+) Transcript_99013:341-754(+)